MQDLVVVVSWYLENSRIASGKKAYYFGCVSRCLSVRQAQNFHFSVWKKDKGSKKGMCEDSVI